MPKSLDFSDFVYQIVINGSSILVFDDKDEARNYVEENYKGTEVLIHPIPVFSYTGGKEGS